MAYRMDHKYRGVAVIFNHTVFCGRYPERGYTETDVKRLEGTFENLGFDVRSRKDLTLSEIQSELLKVAEWYGDQDRADCDCVVVAVLSHGGEKESLAAKDKDYDVRTLLTPLVRCKSLQGKPKLFFFQACKSGQETVPDSGTEVTYVDREAADSNCGEVSGSTVTSRDGDAADSNREETSVLSPCVVPTDPDILLSYATFEGQFAFRRPEEGSPYIKALCSELDENGDDEDLLSLLTRVNRTVGQTFLSSNPAVTKYHEKVQQPCYTSSLTRRLYLRKRR